MFGFSGASPSTSFCWPFSPSLRESSWAWWVGQYILSSYQKDTLITRWAWSTTQTQWSSRQASPPSSSSLSPSLRSRCGRNIFLISIFINNVWQGIIFKNFIQFSICMSFLLRQKWTSQWWEECCCVCWSSSCSLDSSPSSFLRAGSLLKVLNIEIFFEQT